MGYARISLGIDEWPQRDRELWKMAVQAGDPLEPDGAAAHWTENTRNQVAKDYGRFLYWLRQNDWLDPQEWPGNRLTKPRLEAYLGHLGQTGMAPTSLLSRIRGLWQALRVLDPGADQASLKRLCTRLKRQAVPTRQKHQRCLDPAILIDACLAHYDRLVVSNDVKSKRDCGHARDALLLVFLAFHPIRLANLANLQIGRQIIIDDNVLQLELGSDETKEHRPYMCPIDQQLAPYLKHYIEHVRPLLLQGACCSHLWISSRRGPLSASAIYYQVIKMTDRLVGTRINPHLIRDCVLTALAEHSPENVRLGARILGHSDLRTGEKHYNHASTISAQRAYFKVIAETRARFAAKKRERN